MSSHESSLQPDVHQLYFHYQQEVHNDVNPLLKEDIEEEMDWGNASSQYVQQAKSMLRATYSESSALSRMVSSFTGFYRFLVETPFLNDNNCGGTHHQQYRINNVLVAVGVVDIIPDKGLSSVYAFYNPIFAKNICPLGKYMILQEIEYCKQNKLTMYYLGYYIHSCSKMRYKIEYQPSELLCPTTFRWVDASEARAIIEKESPDHHCCTLAPNDNIDNKAKEQFPSKTNIDRKIAKTIPLDVGLESYVTIDMLQENGQDIVRPLVEEFVSHVGTELSHQFILKLI
eukprot:CAMPEP_0194179062 /NCGR_PEP_ID=MMETSP0154-20130528/12581_1 /TAXON_ID=1049557 /ORGANISM="Thalassiothrix antarctica, Strain L6-D1" /LENGTH=285 /DNA_ID=CAMNT_0038894271 /DNA_START=17 /DNA_END=874 /DNA_ORIENTATION=+